MRNTISMLTMFVTVLMTSCHVSLQWNNGPVTIQSRVIPQIAIKAELDPAAFAVLCAIVANQYVFIEVSSMLMISDRNPCRSPRFPQRVRHLTGFVLHNNSTNAETATSTNGAGEYAIVNIVPGSYSLRVSKQGFQSAQQPASLLASLIRFSAPARSR